MSETIRIKPRAGLIVRDPETFQILATEGEVKRNSQYWQRRLRDGDVIEVKETEEPEAETGVE